MNKIIETAEAAKSNEEHGPVAAVMGAKKEGVQLVIVTGRKSTFSTGWEASLVRISLPV